MKLCMNDLDTICLENGVIKLVLDGKDYAFKLEEIEEGVIITTDMGPMYDDMCIALRINQETAIFMMSGHPQYEHFLFQELGKALTIDYEQIIKASCCIEKNVFSIYKRDK